jgi:hypothetical protein
MAILMRMILTVVYNNNIGSEQQEWFMNISPLPLNLKHPRNGPKCATFIPLHPGFCGVFEVLGGRDY